MFVMKYKKRTFDSLRKILEQAESTANNSRPPIAQAIRHIGRGHLHESRQRQDTQLLVVDARKLVLSVDSCEPEVKELPSSSSLLRLHDMERSNGVVENRVDQDLEVCKTESLSDRLIEEGESGIDDDMEVL